MMNTFSLDVVNPSTDAQIDTLECDSIEDALAKLERAQHFFNNRKAHLALHERVALLEKLVTYLSERKSIFVDTMIAEGGKPYRDSVVEFDRAVLGVKLAISSISERVGSSIPLGYQPASSGRIATTQVFPRGVVLAFSAFNHPLNLIVHQVIPAFASGCPCVVKPAPDTPLSCVMLVDAMHAVGIAKDYISVVLTHDIAVASALVESDKIAFFSFIGSAQVGWMLRSKLAPGVRCALEHGGVAPSIVARSADIPGAVNAIVKGGFYHAGQVCVSTQRVYLDQTIFDDFVGQFVRKVQQLVVGDARDEHVDVGPLIRPSEVDRIDGWVKEAISEGAECPVGGARLNPIGNFYAPTVLLNPSPIAKVTRREIFGPVVCIYKVDSIERACEMSNHDEFAFQASVFAQNLDEITYAYQSIDASAMMVNDHTAFRDDVMPFAGLKRSGLGVGGIPYTIEDMQFEKMLVIKQ